MSADGPTQGARPPVGGGAAANAASLGGVSSRADGPTQGARPPLGGGAAANVASLGGASSRADGPTQGARPHRRGGAAPQGQDAEASTPLLSLAGVGKDYAKVESNRGRLRLVWDLLRGRGAAHVFRALDGVSFELQRGASLGVIGENGAGKSTLLKIVAGVIQPTRGKVAVRGRIGALLELGSGFHPEYTGLANIDLAAALLGLGPAEIAAKRDEIIAFADLGEHIRDPIKNYSSGMVVRLGFAVATTLRPDVLITDEVLAVGDESFQKKCIAWMETYLADGGTLLLCSHSMYHVQKLCRHALWLRDGEVVRYGDAPAVTQAYLAYHEEKSATAKTPIPRAAASAAGVYAVQSLELDPGEIMAQGSALAIRGEVYSPDGRPPVVLVGLVRADGTPVYGVATDMDRVLPRRVANDRYAFALEFPVLQLLPGKYFVRAHALDPEGVRLFDHVERPLTITGDAREFGLVRLPHRWGGDAP
jgi:lipopolysaccharide transport system ATP-binding protein